VDRQAAHRLPPELDKPLLTYSVSGLPTLPTSFTMVIIYIYLGEKKKTAPAFESGVQAAALRPEKIIV